MEYQNARIFTNSLGLQAVVERKVSQSDAGSDMPHAMQADVDTTDYCFVQEVVDGSLEILQTAIKLSESNVLGYSPVRVFLRITTASIFLLKGLSIGVSASKLRTSLDILTRGIAALKSASLDDMHVGLRYAQLLEMHLVRLQKNFAPSVRPSTFATRPPSADKESSMTNTCEGAATSRSALPGAVGLGSDDLFGQSDLMEDWMTLPFDPSLISFGPGDTQGFAGLDDGALDFIWNLE